jgi:3-oxoacyl-[acyl-carrier-protein] synthase-3
MIPMGGMRSPRSRQEPTAVEDDFGNARTGENLFMNGVEVFNFTAETVPASVNKLFERANLDDSKVDLYLFHQAGKPTLKRSVEAGRLQPGARVVLVGFGVGYSWAATAVRWT